MNQDKESIALIITLGQRDVQIKPNNENKSFHIPKSSLKVCREVFEKSLDKLKFTGQNVNLKEIDRVDDINGFANMLESIDSYEINLLRVKKIFKLIHFKGYDIKKILLVSTNRLQIAQKVIEVAGEKNIALDERCASNHIIESEQNFAGIVVKKGIKKLYKFDENNIDLFEIGSNDYMYRNVNKLLEENEIQKADESLDLNNSDMIYRTLDEFIKKWWNALEKDVERVIFMRVGGTELFRGPLLDVLNEYIPDDKLEIRTIPITREKDLSFTGDQWKEFYSTRRFLRFLIERYDFLTAAEYLESQKSKGSNELINKLFEELYLLINGWKILLRENQYGSLNINEYYSPCEKLLDSYKGLINIRDIFRSDIFFPISAEAVRVLYFYRSNDLDLFLSHLITLYELCIQKFCYDCCKEREFFDQEPNSYGLPKLKVNVKTIKKAKKKGDIFAKACFLNIDDNKRDFFDRVADNFWINRSLIKEKYYELEQFHYIIMTEKPFNIPNGQITINLKEMRNILHHQAIGTKSKLLKEIFNDENELFYMLRDLLSFFEINNPENILNSPENAKNAIINYLRS